MEQKAGIFKMKKERAEDRPLAEEACSWPANRAQMSWSCLYEYGRDFSFSKAIIF